jgi:hypothetical protein
VNRFRGGGVARFNGHRQFFVALGNPLFIRSEVLRFAARAGMKSTFRLANQSTDCDHHIRQAFLTQALRANRCAGQLCEVRIAVLLKSGDGSRANPRIRTQFAGRYAGKELLERFFGQGSLFGPATSAKLFALSCFERNLSLGSSVGAQHPTTPAPLG